LPPQSGYPLCRGKVSKPAGGGFSVRRTYEIKPGPQGPSCARGIARKYGIELSQILATLKERQFFKKSSTVFRL
jgi:hypothetical protein